MKKVLFLLLCLPLLLASCEKSGDKDYSDIFSGTTWTGSDQAAAVSHSFSFHKNYKCTYVKQSGDEAAITVEAKYFYNASYDFVTVKDLANNHIGLATVNSSHKMIMAFDEVLFVELTKQ